MNLSQMRMAVRDILTAGQGNNSAINDDPFWTDIEINYNINRAQAEVYKIIRRARADYFTRILRSTDSPFRINGADFDPATLRWVVGQGNYVMPPDFVRMKMITDLSSQRVRLSASDVSKHEFRILLNSQSSGNGAEFLYDILGVRTLVIRPFPSDERDFEYIYEKTLPLLRDYTVTQALVIQESTAVAVGDGQTANIRVGDEIIVGTTAAAAKADPNKHYTAVKSIDSAFQVTLEGLSDVNNSDMAGNGGAGYVTFSSVSEIPLVHHDMLVCLAASFCFAKGTNPSTEGVELWRGQYDSMIPALVNDVESRQGSDIETVEAYMEDMYD